MCGLRRLLAEVLALLLLLLLTGCRAGPADPDTRERPPRLTAEIVQLRRDEVLERVEVAVTNRSEAPVTVESIDLQVPGFGGARRQVTAEPLPAGQRVNLPTPYGEVVCSATGEALVGRPRVVVRLRTATDPGLRRVVLRRATRAAC